MIGKPIKACVVVGALVALLAGVVWSEELAAPQWWDPAPSVLYKYADGSEVVKLYVPADPLPAGMKVVVGATFPHFKDPIWVSHNYGLAVEAARLGIQVYFQNPGGYTEIERQVDIMENFVGQGMDAILLASVSDTALVPIAEATQGEGTPVFVVANDLAVDAPLIQEKIVCTYDYIGESCGQYVLGKLPSGGSVALLPGPAGASWSEQTEQGFLRALQDRPDITVIATKWGETDKDIQRALIENVLTAFPDVNYIVGNALAVVSAADILSGWPSSKPRPKLVSTYYIPAVLDGIRGGTIEAVALEPVTLVEFIAANEIAKYFTGWYAAHGEQMPTHIVPLPSFGTAENIESINWTWIAAPEDWEVHWTNL